MNRIGILIVLLALSPGLAHASGTQQGKQVLLGWVRMDMCAKQAQKAFPDFTAESNAKRDEALKKCLAGSNLPPRESISPPQPAPGH